MPSTYSCVTAPAFAGAAIVGEGGNHEAMNKPKELRGAPSIAQLAKLVRAIKPDICDDYKDSQDDVPHIDLTIGADEKSWSYQTGGNSFSGGAYDYAHWGVGSVTRRCNSRDVARDILNDLFEQVC